MGYVQCFLFQLYLAEQFDVVERWLYEDSCSIEVWSDGSGWEQVFFAGGWDNDRYFRLLYQGVDPEYNTYNGDISSETVTGWLNFTEDGMNLQIPKKEIQLT